jgi:3-dehydroquinate synthase
MKNYFKIENELLSFNINEIKKSEFTVNSSPYNYSVKFIDNKYLSKILATTKNINKKKHFLFVDKIVNKHYHEKFWRNEIIISITANEKNKTIQSSLVLIDTLNKNNYTKKDILISIGGGITQDVTAFARSVYKRGIDWIYFPTTLLSMADSCIGAKSAINYAGSKNLIGLFSAPKEVYINVEFLNSLNIRDVLSGYGEILKLCIVGGNITIDQFKKIKDLQKNNLFFQIDSLIKIALLVKKTVIIKDEFEINIRKALNYGHTIGHAIEPIVNFNIPHGIAVSIGMFVENCISYEYGYLDLDSCLILNKIIIDYIDDKSMVYLKKITVDELLLHMKKDKKNELSNISFAVPIEIGHFKILQLKNDKKLKKIIENSFKKLIKND